MKEIQTNGITILLVEVPEDATYFNLHHNILLYPLGNDDVDGIRLPIGQYQILGKSTELSEEQMKEICDKWKYGWNNYLYPDTTYYPTVQESYLSLLEANGIVDRVNYDKPICDCNGKCTEEQQFGCLGDHVIYEEAQSKVKHYLVLKRI
jgi:hypothetical protein